MNNSSISNATLLPKCIKQYNPQYINNLNGDLLTAVYVLIAVATLLSNIAFVVGLWKTKERLLLRSSKLFMLLSVVDILLGVIYSAWTAYAIQMNISCAHELARGGFGTCLRLLSCIIILIIAVDRYLTVVHTELHRKYFTDRTVIVIIIIAAMVSLAFSMCYTLPSPERLPNSHGIVEINYHTPAISILCASFFVVGILVSAMAVNLALSKSVQRKAKYSTAARRECGDANTYDRVLSKTIMLVCIAILICYLPPIICWLIVGFCYLLPTNEVEIPINVLIWFAVSDQINCILNCCIYITRNRRIKKFYEVACFRLLDSDHTETSADTQTRSTRLSCE